MLQNNVNLKKTPYVFEPVVLEYPEEIKGLVSIIIPIYNTELYLKETLDSVIAQTFENWEAILIDDGSTDRSHEICIEYAKRDSRFKYIRKNNEGTLLARKTALENSKGEFIASLDSDDAYHPQFLEKMFTKIKDGDNDFVYCCFKDLDGQLKYSVVKNCKLDENKLENCYNIKKYQNYTWNKLIKRNIYAKILFPMIHFGFRGEDMIQSLQIIYYSKKAEFISDSLYLYRYRSISSVANSPGLISEEKSYVRRITGMIIFYLLTEHFFGSNEADKLLIDFGMYECMSFACYFFLSKKAIKHYEIEYAQNFVPFFLSGLSKSKHVNPCFKVILILASKNFTLPFRIFNKIYLKLQKTYWVYVIYKKKQDYLNK